MSRSVAAGGVTFGTLIAALCSWDRNHDILLALVHGFLSWAYVLYYAVTK